MSLINTIKNSFAGSYKDTVSYQVKTMIAELETESSRYKNDSVLDKRRRAQIAILKDLALRLDLEL